MFTGFTGASCRHFVDTLIGEIPPRKCRLSKPRAVALQNEPLGCGHWAIGPLGPIVCTKSDLAGTKSQLHWGANMHSCYGQLRSSISKC